MKKQKRLSKALSAVSRVNSLCCGRVRVCVLCVCAGIDVWLYSSVSAHACVFVCVYVSLLGSDAL